MSRRDAAKVLAGDPATAPEVAALLAAAQPPVPASAEIPGELEALAAFRVARSAAPAAGLRRNRLAAARAAAIAALSTKFAIGAAAALAAGGVVLAASTGVLRGTGTTDHPKHGIDHTPTTAASPSPDLRGLCTAYRSVSQSPGRALNGPAFSALSSAARPDSVPDFCSRLLAAGASGDHPIPPTGRPIARPTPSRSVSHPAGPSVSHPTGRPTTVPTPPHATGRQTAPVSPRQRVVPQPQAH